MRADKKTGEESKDIEVWRRDLLTGRAASDVERYELPDARQAKMSFSGSERNKLFMKVGEKFRDLSGLSGLDTKLDSRNIAVFDYNRDGFQDFLVSNVNGQMLNVYRNGFSQFKGENHNFVAVRFRGGNRQAKPIQGYCNRDGIGARAIVRAGELRIERELRCGEGFAAQNSSTLVIGIGRPQKAKSIEVVWPSGTSTVANDIPTGSVVTFFEDTSESENGLGYFIDVYEPVVEKHSVVERSLATFPLDDAIPDSEAQLTIVTTMATWCAACKSRLPQIARLSKELSNTVKILAIPIDEHDSPTRLRTYVETLNPAYELLPLEQSQVAKFQKFVETKTGTTALPSTVVINVNGEVEGVFKGVPSLSELKQILIDYK